MKLNIALALLAFTALTIAAEDQPQVPFPSGYRSWQHLKTRIVGAESKNFSTRGGIHHFYANDKAMEGLASGKFPNGSILVEEILFTKEGEGDTKGITSEGERRSLDVMVKNDRLYSESGGWGFEHFVRDSQAGVLPAEVRAQCLACHAKQKDRDYVFSTPRK